MTQDNQFPYLRFLKDGNRFSFVNWHYIATPTFELNAGGFGGGKNKVRLGYDNGGVTCRLEKGEASVNGEPLSAERPFNDGDQIELGQPGDSKTVMYMMQLDPRKAKIDRLEEEKQAGVEPALPDLETPTRYSKWLKKHINIDENGIYHRKRKKTFLWPDVDEIGWYGLGIGALGLIVMGQPAKGDTIYDELFQKGSFSPVPRFQGKDLINWQKFLNGAQAPTCVLFAKWVEFYSPVDLIRIG